MKTINKLLAIAGLSSVAFFAFAETHTLNCPGMMYYAGNGSFIECGGTIKANVPKNVHIPNALGSNSNIQANDPWAHFNNTYVCDGGCSIQYDS